MDKVALLETEAEETHCPESILTKTQRLVHISDDSLLFMSSCVTQNGKCPLDVAELTTNSDSLFINLCLPKGMFIHVVPVWAITEMMSNYVMMVNNNNHLAAACSVSSAGKDFVQLTKKCSQVRVLIGKKGGRHV